MPTLRTVLLCCLLCCCIPFSPCLHAQDSLAKKFDFDFSLRNRYMMPFGLQRSGGRSGPAHVHPFLLNHRSNVFDSTTYNPRQIQDNPVFHNALQVGFHARLRVSNSVKMEFDLLGEQQGFSYGIYNPDRSFLFPMVRVDGGRTFHLFKQDFYVGGALGSFRNFRLNEGLTMYGLDVQGIDGTLRWEKLRFRYVQFSDLTYWVGLNMQEPITMNLRLDSLTLSDAWSLDLGTSYLFEAFLSGPSVNLALYRGAGFRLYAEAGMNLRDHWLGVPVGTPEGLQDDVALVAGMHWTHSSPKLNLKARAEFRYYGNEYIFGLKYENIGFKGSDAELVAFESRARRAFYPLHYLDRPFAQLGFFTDFQETWYSTADRTYPDVAAASLVVDAQYKLPWELYLDGYVDFNLVMVDGFSPFLYPFFRVGLGWEPAPGNTIALNITNKAMDYQLHYPTHQLMARPFIGLFAARDLPDWKKKTWR